MEFQAHFKCPDDSTYQENLHRMRLCLPRDLYTLSASAEWRRRTKKFQLQTEDTLEEMWRIKREIGEEYPTWNEYVAGILAFQEEERKRGVKFVSFSSEATDNQNVTSDLFVAEDGASYDALAKD